MSTETRTGRDLLPDLTTPLARLVLAVGDDELIVGHRASHWTGVAPSLEEDLAFATISQDEVNHADTWYGLLVDDPEGGDRVVVDELGLGREPGEYRHAAICAQPPVDFVHTLARHWLYDHFDAVRLAALAGSSHEDVAGLSEKLLREERYHLLHADQWFQRLVGDEARGRGEFAAALRTLLPDALWLFEPLDGEDELHGLGLWPERSEQLRERWLEGVVAALEAAGIADEVLPTELRPVYATPGGRRGVHTDDFLVDVHPEMTHLHRTHPGASW
jgi:ring-1,2-phenylacetyl-CoA epoxidase subunit PaaC